MSDLLTALAVVAFLFAIVAVWAFRHAEPPPWFCRLSLWWDGTSVPKGICPYCRQSSKSGEHWDPKRGRWYCYAFPEEEA